MQILTPPLASGVILDQSLFLPKLPSPDLWNGEVGVPRCRDASKASLSVAASGCYCYGCLLQRIWTSRSNPGPWQCAAPWQPGPAAGPITVHLNKANNTVSSAAVTPYE